MLNALHTSRALHLLPSILGSPGLALVLILTFLASCDGPNGDPEGSGGQGSQAGSTSSGGRGGGGAELPRLVFEGMGSLSLCEAGTCAAGLRCFEMTGQFGICDPGVPEATECGMDADAPPDQCACNGLVCPSSHICRSLQQTCSCQGYHSNVCVERACESPADCPDGDVCIPSSLIVGARCITPRCRTDTDCSTALGGRCLAVVTPPLQAGNVSLKAVRCFYRGEPPTPSAACPQPAAASWLETAYTCDPP